MGNYLQCKQLNQESLPAYGFYSIRRQQGLSAVIERKIAKSKNQKIELSKIFNKKLRFDHTNIIKLKKFFFEEDDYSFKLVLVYPLITTTLAHRFESVDKNFSQEEIKQIINDVEGALLAIYQNQYDHSQINKNTILYSEGKYYLTDIRSIKGRNSYQQALSGETDGVLLSPQLMEQLKFKCLLPHQTIYDDLFSLGMVVLSIMVDEDASIFYNWNELVVKDKVVDFKLQEAGKKYSSIIIKRVKDLLGGVGRYECQEGKVCLQETLSTVNESYLNIYQRMRAHGYS